MSEHRFLDSDVPDPQQFEALGHAGSSHYAGLETFPNPGCYQVVLEFDELMSRCPITGQPDFYAGRIFLTGAEKLVESKSLKLFFHNIIESHTGLFGETLAVYIRDQIAEALGVDQEAYPGVVTVELSQKSRGGIAIIAKA
jgi:7-cyano-7-deazaguanine reductase